MSLNYPFEYFLMYFIYVYVYIFGYMSTCVWMPTDDSLELKLQVVVSNLLWVLGTELRSMWKSSHCS